MQGPSVDGNGAPTGPSVNLRKPHTVSFTYAQITRSALRESALADALAKISLDGASWAERISWFGHPLFRRFFLRSVARQTHDQRAGLIGACETTFLPPGR
jgi:hypothetical protein